MTEDGLIQVAEVKSTAASPRPQRRNSATHERTTLAPTGPVRIYLHGVNRELLERASRDLEIDVRIASRVDLADLIIALRTRADDMGLKKITRLSDAPLQYIKRNTTAEIRRLLQKIFNLVQGVDEEEIREAIEETEAAVRKALEEGMEVALSPRRPTIRKVQHRYISSLGIVAQSVGKEPDRHLVIYPVEKDS